MTTKQNKKVPAQAVNDQVKNDQVVNDQVKNDQVQGSQAGLNLVSLFDLVAQPKTKLASEKSAVQKVVLKSLSVEDTLLDYLGFSVSLFGKIVNLNDISAISRKIDHSVLAGAVSLSGVGSLDCDDNLAGVVSVGGQVVELVAVEKMSAVIDPKANKQSHQGLSSWAVSMMMKHIFIVECLKAKKSIKIASPVSFAYVNSSFKTFVNSGVFSPMSIEKIEILKSSLGVALVEKLVSLGLLVEISLSDLSLSSDEIQSLILAAIEKNKVQSSSSSSDKA